MLTVIFSALKMFSKYEKNASLNFRCEETRILDNAIQHYWKLVVERLYHIEPWLGGRMHSAEGVKMFIKNVALADRNQQVRMGV